MKIFIFFILFITFKPIFAQSINFSENDALFLQVCSMYYLDEYDYTKPNVYEQIHIGNRIITTNISKEGNPVAKFFQQNNMWNEYYLGSILLTKESSKFLRSMDNNIFKNSPIKLEPLFLGGLSLMEIVAIHSWAKNNYGPPETNWTLFQLSF